MTLYEIHCSKVSDGILGGPFAVYVVRVNIDGSRSLGASCTFIRTAAACLERAREYARWYEGPIVVHHPEETAL